MEALKNYNVDDEHYIVVEKERKLLERDDLSTSVQDTFNDFSDNDNADTKPKHKKADEREL